MIKILTAILVLLVMTSCSSTEKHQQQVEILSMQKVIDTSMPDNQICTDFVITKTELMEYFLIADQVSSSVYDGSAVVLPCQYEGKLLMNEETFSYEVIAGGAGSIFNDNGWTIKHYLCLDDNCCNQFSNLC